MRCRVCRETAAVEVRRHNAAFCTEHFVRHCHDQVARTIEQFRMIAPGDRVLVAVSGGKDSLALWDVLLELGYETDGFYVGLGIGDYSDESHGYAARFAEAKGRRLVVHDLRRDHGFDIPNGSRAARRAPCSACGLSKRHLFDRAAVDGGYDTLATGHNLDDEAAVLFGNVLHWQTEYLARQMPVLPARAGFPRKVKPLVRLGERETAAYCVLRSIDYILDECPMAEGNRHLGYKDVLNQVEVTSPGAKHAFYFGFLDRAAERFQAGQGPGADPAGAEGAGPEGTGPEGAGPDGVVLGACERCGAPSAGAVCSFCRLVERATAPQPIRFRTRQEAPR